MALKKSTRTPSWATVEYWNIKTFQAYWPEALVDVTMMGFHSQEGRENGAEPMATLGPIRLTFAEMGIEPGNDPTRAAIYEAIKVKAATDDTLQVIAGAEDC